MERSEHEYQSLRAVDPGAVVERPPVSPEAGNLGVAPLVRGQRRVPEGEAPDDGEARGREDAERWGPPRELDRRTAALVVLATAAALAVAVEISGLTLTPPQYLLVLLVPALVLRRARRYVLDFVPFGVLIMLYAQARGLAHILHPHAYYMPQYDAEKFLFAGHFPSADLQHWLWQGHARWWDHAVSLTTKIHFIVPPLLAFSLWLKRRALFYRYGATMILLSFAAAFTFWLFPAAPPWAAAQSGRIPHVLLFSDARPSALPSANHSSHLYNPYAAIPSLHAGYAFLAFLFVAMLAWRTRWRWLAVGVGIVYPLAQSFAVIYTANHYVVDLLIGSLYATAALFAVRWFWRRRGWPE
jgi:hypothetical protein